MSNFVVELGSAQTQFRSQALEEILKSQDIAWKGQPATPEDFEERLQEVVSDSTTRQIRLEGWAQSQILQNRDHRILETAHLGVADAFVRTPVPGASPQWWPRNFLAPAFREILARDITDLDLSGSAMIIGATPLARAAITAIASYGIRRFLLTDSDFGRAEEFDAEMKRRNFGYQIRLVRDSEVTQLPSVCSFAVNTVDELSEQFAREISYFNFLRPLGYWIDFGLNSFRQEFEEEILSTKARLESPAPIWALADANWLHQCFGIEDKSKELSERYQTILGKFGLSNS